MLTGIDFTQTRKYVSKYDPDKEKPTIFHIGMLSPAVKTYIDDQTISFEKGPGGPDGQATQVVKLGTKILLTLRFGITNIENLGNPSKPGELILFDSESVRVGNQRYTTASANMIGIIPDQVKSELYDEITKENQLTEPEIKN